MALADTRFRRRCFVARVCRCVRRRVHRRVRFDVLRRVRRCRCCAAAAANLLGFPSTQQLGRIRSFGPAPRILPLVLRVPDYQNFVNLEAGLCLLRSPCACLPSACTWH